ncbi:glycosyltransferase 28 domain-containing protein [Nitritalea halalkaliphila LW7]|uniref:Glycosyltransferase 28 domain-containing protein n=1 Tax=Nitritalea halalkaliphila LW7 TaxID=1189621 RepID=I5C925_9BACT|nr:glycosyltransferase 28 domain-containing protein [Nitritalea halalkaliphila]EIM78327.1 glycosyltransferase 28 domain-containing protein [Nitritalea halalkaliphila LW7]
MKIAFIIQGEGRGHLSQALALAPILEAAGWEICAVLIGQSRRRSLPAYVQAGFKKPIVRFASPNFALQRGAVAFPMDAPWAKICCAYPNFYVVSASCTAA